MKVVRDASIWDCLTLDCIDLGGPVSKSAPSNIACLGGWNPQQLQVETLPDLDTAYIPELVWQLRASQSNSHKFAT